MLLKKAEVDGVVITTDAKRCDRAEFVAGVDAGSTQTRVCLASSSDAMLYRTEDRSKFKQVRETLHTQYILPSTYANVADEKEIAPHSALLSDNLDSRLLRVQTASKDPIFTTLRVIRGPKIRDTAGAVPRYLDSSTQKVDNPIFYVNVLDGLGYAVLQRTYLDAIPRDVYLRLIVSVRPKEMSTIAKEKLTSNLKGEFIFCWKDIKFTMHITSIDFTTEPEAQIEGTTAMYSLSDLSAEDSKVYDQLANGQSYIAIEGGGSSIGVEVIRDGAIIEQCSSTFPLGGNYLVRQVIDLVREHSGRTPSEASVQEAIKTGLLRNGVNQEDISGIIMAAKDQVALDIIERVRHQVIDVTSDLTMNDMEFIVISGRLFAYDGYGGSIAQPMERYVSQLSPHTALVHLQDNYIPEGNLLIGLNEEDTWFTAEPVRAPEVPEVEAES